MDSSSASDFPSDAVAQATAELIVENGRQRGANRVLTKVLTVVGRADDCDIRLSMEEADERHCVIGRGPMGWEIRDLGTSTGTYVNGASVREQALGDGDVITIGTLRFSVRLHAPAPSEIHSDADALRVQAAAVVAQQVALDEQEALLRDRQLARQAREQEAQAQFEDKQRQLRDAAAACQAERAALEEEKENFERHLQLVNSNLTDLQRDYLEDQRKLAGERRHFKLQQVAVRRRWQRVWHEQSQRLEDYEQALIDRASDVAAESEKVRGDRLQFQGFYELGRRKLADAWQHFRAEEGRWQRRRQLEREALKLRARQLDGAVSELQKAYGTWTREKESWQRHKGILQSEMESLNTRSSNLSSKLAALRADIVAAETQLAIRRRSLEEAASKPAVVDDMAATVTETVQPTTGVETSVAASLPEIQPAEIPSEHAVPISSELMVVAPEAAAAVPALESSPITPVDDEEPTADLTLAILEENLRRRLHDTEIVAGDLSDQRLVLVEHWQRLTLLHQRWESERRHSIGELHELALKLREQGLVLAHREEALTHSKCDLGRRDGDLTSFHQQLVVWQARLRSRERELALERAQMDTLAKHRDEISQRQLSSLVQLRQRWARSRRQELDKLRADRAVIIEMRQEQKRRLLEVAQRSAGLEEERRILTEKGLVLEQYRQEFLAKEPGAARRVERLRRRWLTQNAEYVRAATRARESLKEEIRSAAERFADILKRGEYIERMEAEFAERQSALEHKELLLRTHEMRMGKEMEHADYQRRQAESHAESLKLEIEQIARALLDEESTYRDAPALESAA